jgi:hypothetical protein
VFSVEFLNPLFQGQVGKHTKKGLSHTLAQLDAPSQHTKTTPFLSPPLKKRTSMPIHFDFDDTSSVVSEDSTDIVNGAMNHHFRDHDGSKE